MIVFLFSISAIWDKHFFLGGGGAHHFLFTRYFWIMLAIYASKERLKFENLWIKAERYCELVKFGVLDSMVLSLGRVGEMWCFRFSCSQCDTCKCRIQKSLVKFLFLINKKRKKRFESLVARAQYNEKLHWWSLNFQ